MGYTSFINEAYTLGENIPINISWCSHNTFNNPINFCNDFLKQNGINDFIDKDNCYKNRDYLINHIREYPDDKEGIKKLLKKK